MIQLTDKIIAISVPEDAYEFTNEHDMVWYKTLPRQTLNDDSRMYNWMFEISHLKVKIIGTITKSVEFDFDCEKHIKPFYQKESIWHNYNANSLDNAWDCNTKEQSFISLLNNKGIFLEKLNNEKILILEKI